MSQYTIERRYKNPNIANSDENVWNNYTVADDLSPLITWLSRLDPGLRHSGIQERRVNDVGEWLMDTEEFRRWYGLSGEGEGDEAVLFCYGNPGVGKTFISSLVVDKLADRTKGQNAAVICFYFDFAAREEQTATSMLGSLLKQMISGMERVPENISRALQKKQEALTGRKPQLGDIVEMLQLITSSQPTFMVVDALDECTAAQRFRLFDSLKEILENSPHARIFLTGRPYIRAEIERCFAGRIVSVLVGPTKDDMIRFLRVRLGEDETPDAMDEGLEAEILEKLPGSLPEMFILVSFNIEAILQEATLYRRREMLSKMIPGLGLGDAYGATIERIKAQGGDKSRLGMGALMWVSHAERPLMADELCHALAIELGSTDFNAGNIPSIATLVSCCQGLITVDKEASTVRLVHFTLKEYCSAHPDIFNRHHSAMAEICLTYLNSQHVRDLEAYGTIHSRGGWDQDTFLEYCSLYWGVHAKQDLSNRARSLALKLLEEYDRHVSAYFIAKKMGTLDLSSYTASYRLSGVHCASLFGIVEIVPALLEMRGYDTNMGWYLGDSPLAWAARAGHEEVAEMLVGWEGVDPNQPNDYGQTPLSYAAAYGREGVVEILLGRADVNPDRRDHRGRTPLSYAVKYGHEGVVKILLRQVGVSPGRIDKLGRTLLSHAAGNGQEMMVKMLLGREEVDPDKPDREGKTALWRAAGGGHEGVVRMLLGRGGVNPSKPDNEGKTPLSHAAEGGHERVVELLLGREEVDPDKPDNKGKTLLWHAVNRGYERVLKMLLSRAEVDLDKPDCEGRVPLSYAAGGGHERVVELLLSRKEVDPDKPDNDGRTPLFYAAMRGYGFANMGQYNFAGGERVMKLLLGRKEVSCDKPDNKGRTPLSIAVWVGFEGAVKLLLGKDEVDPDKPDNDGRTPLWYAAGDLHSSAAAEGVVKLLLGREEVSSDRPDNEGRTPLSHAAQQGYEGMVKILLGRDEVDPDKPDNDGRTPLWYAAGHSRGSAAAEGVVKLLLGREEVSSDRPDNEGRTPLSLAAQRRYAGVVKMLLGREEVNPHKRDNLGRTPLMYAASGAHQVVLMLLQSHEAVALARPNAEQSPPLNAEQPPPPNAEQPPPNAELSLVELGFMALYLWCVVGMAWLMG